MKLIFRLVKLFILLVILGLIFNDFAAKILLTGFLRCSLGVPVQMKTVEVSLGDTEVEIRGLKLGNPSGFPEGTLVYIPKIYLDLESWDLLRGRIHVEVLEIDCQDIRIVRDIDGRVNWLSLKVLPAQKPETKPKPEDKGRPFSLQIDTLILSLGTASYVDLYSAEPVQKNLKLNVRKADFSDVNSFQDLIQIIVWETVKRVGIGQMTAAFEGMNKPSTAQGILKKAFQGIKLKF